MTLDGKGQRKMEGIRRDLYLGVDEIKIETGLFHLLNKLL